MKRNYTFPAFFYFDKDGISIEFPDFPWCLPCASTQEEAFTRAKEALRLHLCGMERDNDPIPEPTPISSLNPKDGAVVVMLEVELNLAETDLQSILKIYDEVVSHYDFVISDLSGEIYDPALRPGRDQTVAYLKAMRSQWQKCREDAQSQMKGSVI